MKKSKHFRKDVIMARVIAAALAILLIALIIFCVSLLTKPSGDNQDTQNTQNSESEMMTESEPESEPESESDSEPESESESESEPEAESGSYVTPVQQVRLRKEPNTDCATIALIDPGVKLELLEKLDGWYKVSHDGEVGYVSATYVEIVEE